MDESYMVLGTSRIYVLFLDGDNRNAVDWKEGISAAAAAFCRCIIRDWKIRMSQSAIKIENVSKIYKLYGKPSDRLKEAFCIGRRKYDQEHEALKDISLEVQKGETVGIIGSNGSGKSTLLKIITGVVKASEGNVSVCGRISALLELGAGFHMEYSGIENIYLNGTMNGFSKKEIDEKLDVILKFADIGEFAMQPVKTYSSGMFVRLAFAVAVTIDPEILVVDEALSVGDVFFQAKCYRKFEEFKKQGKTVLLVSHDLGSVSKYCDRVVVLNHGQKFAEGGPKEMIDLYKKLMATQAETENPADKKEMRNTEDGKSFAKRRDVKEWKQRMLLNPNVSSYGDHKAAITDYCTVNEQQMITNTLQKGEVYTIKMLVHFLQEVPDPIFAFTVKDRKGTEITGTNTMFEQVYVGYAAPGSIRQVCFTQKMNLQGGEYLISLGCTGYQDGRFQVYHRLYDVFSITVVSDKNTVGYFDMDSKVSVRQMTQEKE